MTKKDKRVVVVLPILGDRVLMQLRDMKPNIDAPGCWGFFGGAIMPNEDPLQSASRELFEETGLTSKTLYTLGAEKIYDLDHIFAYAFCCLLETMPEKISLTEGMDCAFVTLANIQEKRIFSEKKKQFFPVVPTYFIESTVQKALALKTR